jgi:predicted nucleic acid-binding protein
MVSADTNVFIYSLDPRAPAKQATAKIIVAALIERRALVGLQCAGELQNALRRKLGFAHDQAARLARDLLVRFDTFPPTETAAFHALGDLEAGVGSYFDRLLIRSAAESGCTAFLTEDRQDRRRIEGVEIVPPFEPGGDLSARAREVLEL